MRFFLVSFFFTLFACSGRQGNAVELQQDGAALARLNCAARHLREARFKLADDIRFAEDSIRLYLGNKVLLQARLDSLNGLTEDMQLRTRLTADSFTVLMNTLHSTKYHSMESRKALDNSVEEALKTLCQ